MKNNLNFTLIVLLLVIMGCTCPKDANETTKNSSSVQTTPTEASQSTNSAQTKNAQTKPETKPEETTGVTMANFTKLKTGMKYEEVVKILGKEGEVLSENEIGGIRTVMYKWDGDEGSFGANMNAMFQNGKMTSKSQFGLK